MLGFQVLSNSKALIGERNAQKISRDLAIPCRSPWLPISRLCPPNFYLTFRSVVLGFHFYH